jgi:hypothetical protein
MQYGVHCESCHGAGKDYQSKKVMENKDLAIANGLVMPDDKVCVKCHNEESPSYNPQSPLSPTGLCGGGENRLLSRF